MNDDTKKIVTVVAAIVAVVVLGLSAMKFMGGEKPVVTNSLPPSTQKSEKEMAIEAKNNGGKASGEERDLSK